MKKRLLLVPFLFTLLVPTGPASASHDCGSQTFSIHGTSGNDFFDKQDATKNFCIDGKGGHDTYYGQAESSGDPQGDLVYGMGGDDELFGGMGQDDLIGGDGGDVLAGEWASDFMRGQGGHDYLSGVDDLQDGASLDDDVLIGGPGNDDLVSNDGCCDIDTMYDGTGSDTISGGVQDRWCKANDSDPDDASGFEGAVYNADTSQFCLDD